MEQHEAEQREVEWSEAEGRETERYEKRDGTWNSENQTGIKQGHNQVEPLYTTEKDEQSRENGPGP